DQRAVAPGRMEGEIGRGPVRIDVREPAGDLALLPGRVPDRLLGRRLDAVVEGLEALPGDRRLERIVDDAALDRALARVRHADEGIAPAPGGAFAMRVSGAGLLQLAAVLAAAFE